MSAEERARIVERYRGEIERLEAEGRHWEVNRVRRELHMALMGVKEDDTGEQVAGDAEHPRVR